MDPTRYQRLYHKLSFVTAIHKLLCHYACVTFLNAQGKLLHKTGFILPIGLADGRLRTCMRSHFL